MTKSRLRVKTGCLNCKRLKKKCDEVTPVCGRCLRSKQTCHWPGSEDLVDRRFLTSARSRHEVRQTNGLEKDSQSSVAVTSVDSNSDGSLSDGHAPPEVSETVPARKDAALTWRTRPPLLADYEAFLAHANTVRDMESVMSRHFFEDFYKFVILPGYHRQHCSARLLGLVGAGRYCAPLRFALMACSASHIYAIDENKVMRNLNMTYYSKAIVAMSKLLTHMRDPEKHDGLLTCIQMLCVHGTYGIGTNADMPQHIKAAEDIGKARISKNGPAKTIHDTMAIEGILYFSFLSSVGHWSGTPAERRGFDLAFWRRAEAYLDFGSLLPGNLPTYSPALGVPSSLLRLALQVQHHSGEPLRPDPREVKEIQNELLCWEACLATFAEPAESTPASNVGRIRMHKDWLTDVRNLYILAGSLVATYAFPERVDTYQESQSRDQDSCWQTAFAKRLLRSYKDDDNFTKNHTGNWPVYTLAYFSRRPEDRAFFKAELEMRWKLAKVTQLTRFLDDLETAPTPREELMNASPASTLPYRPMRKRDDLGHIYPGTPALNAVDVG